MRMFAVSHVVAGGAIGKRIGSPYLALPVAFLSHFALDAIPHIDSPSIYPGVTPPLWLGALEGGALVVALAFLFCGQTNRLPMALGAIAGILPDVIAWLGRAFPPMAECSVMRFLHWLHYTYHPSLPGSQWPLGLGTQVVVIALSFALVYRRRAVKS
jgi:hypothetical protein